MAEKTKLSLSRAYTFAGKTFGPGDAEVPNAAVESLKKKEQRAQDRIAQGYEPPAPVTPSTTRGELHDPRKRAVIPTSAAGVVEPEQPRRNVAQDSVRSVRSNQQDGGASQQGGAQSEDLSSLTVADLHDRAKAANIEGQSSMNKSELVEALSAKK